MAPRVLISNSMLVPKWADWDTFRELEAAGLTMYGQMTAGSWIYIGTQGILQGTYETLAECAHQRFGGTLQGTVTLTGGLGGMGGAQPLAVTMNGGVALCIEVDPARIERRIKTRYLDRETDDLDDALAWAEEAKASGEAVSIGLLGNCAEVEPELLRRGWQPDIVTDQTSAHDPLGGYVPGRARVGGGGGAARRRPRRTISAARTRSMAEHVARDGRVPGRGRRRVRLREQPAGGRGARRPAARSRVRLPGVRAGVRAAAVLRGQGPVPLGGACPAIPRTSSRPTAPSPSCSPTTSGCSAGSGWPRSGWRTRDCRRGSAGSGYGERAKAGLRFNEMVAIGRAVRADRDRARPSGQRQRRVPVSARPRTMKDGSDAIADWPILNALINTAAGAHWVSVHHGGGVGIGYSIHAGMVVVADGTENARERLERVLTTDPGTGRDPSRGRRLRARARGRRRARGADPDARTVTDRHIVAMGGGQDVGDPAFRFVAGLVDRPRPKVCLLPTAASAVPVSVMRFLSVFPTDRFELTFLDLFARDDRDVRAYLLAQDLIFVGGGSTANLLAIWRVHGLDAILREAWTSGVVLAGGSAGANCWFEASTTDSFGPLAPLNDGLGLLPGQLLSRTTRPSPAGVRCIRRSSRKASRRGSRATTWRPCTTSGPMSPRSWRRILRRARTGSTEGSTGPWPRRRSPPDSSAAERSRCIPWYRGVALPPCRSEWGER